ncbi:MAG: CAP domain-containing protein [Hyphomicrobiales bacterium]
MLRRTLSLLVLLVLHGCANPVIPQPAPGARAPVEQVRLDPEQARRMINEYRAGKGLGPLMLDERLTVAAKRHAVDMASLDRLDHKGSDGSDPWQRAREAGFRPRVAAENVGAGQRSLAEVMDGWRKSPGHDRNLLLRDATHMGIALEVNPRTRFGTFWTLVLGSPI